jgi:F0F1-type ATP synthase gamma subunit
VFAKKQENTGEKVMSFQKGESGNPAGRPRGARNRATLLMQNLLANDAEAIGRKAIEMAKAGDLAAIRLCMDRLAPARKDEPVAFELPPIEKAADSVAATASIVAAVAAGELTPSQAAELSKVIDVYLRALENKGFDERLTKLENEQKLRSAP